MIKVLAETSWATPEHHCFYIEHSNKQTFDDGVLLFELSAAT